MDYCIIQILDDVSVQLTLTCEAQWIGIMQTERVNKMNITFIIRLHLLEFLSVCYTVSSSGRYAVLLQLCVFWMSLPASERFIPCGRWALRGVVICAITLNGASGTLDHVLLYTLYGQRSPNVVLSVTS